MVHLSYNLDVDVILEELYILKQNKGELFTHFLQWWRHRASKCKWPISEKQQVEIIVGNVEIDFSFQLRMQCIKLFEELISKGINIEWALISRGYTQTHNQSSSSSDKP